MIQVSHLQFDYTASGFRLGVDTFSVGSNERVALIGPSGSGKTTLLNLLAGILVPRSGQVRVNQLEVSSLDDRSRREFRLRTTGLVFQEFELLEYLTVLDNILLPYRISGVLELDAKVRERAASLAEQVGIRDHLRRYPRQLSQGERQRVAVCRALLPQPPLVLADEPTGNLDPVNRDRVLQIILDYTRAQPAALLLVTHEHELLPRFDRVLDLPQLQRGAVR